MQSWHNYYEDQKIRKVLIKYSVKIPNLLEDWQYENHPFFIYHGAGSVYVNYHRNIANTLFSELEELYNAYKEDRDPPEDIIKKNPTKFIIGYLDRSLDILNSELSNKKYNDGHLLLRSVSQFDIFDVFIIDKESDVPSIIPVLWPVPVARFPDLRMTDEVRNRVFIRDLIDAMTEFFYFNYDECIRKLITSLENYFTEYKSFLGDDTISEKIFTGKSKFRVKVDMFLCQENYPMDEFGLGVLKSNILYIYKLRNKIVHSGFRLNMSSRYICKKAIGTLFYIYQSRQIRESNLYDYIFSLQVQFLTHVQILIGMNLDYFRLSSEKKASKIRSMTDFDKKMFQGLRISRKDKKVITGRSNEGL